MKIYIRGVIGDFLQCIPYATSNIDGNEFFIHTHFKGARDFFEEFGIQDAKYFYFQNPQEHDAGVDEILAFCNPKINTNFKECPRTFYFDCQFSDEAIACAEDLANSFSEKKPIIGIHPFGSGFSKDIYSKFNLPIKFIPAETIANLINKNRNYNFFIFGSPQELESWGLSGDFDGLVRFVSFSNIVNSLACVKHCVKLLGTDSCFKTMSSSHKIKTYCLVGDFDDQTRDFYFIDEYVKDGFMKTFRYKNMEQQKSEVFDFFQRAIEE